MSRRSDGRLSWWHGTRFDGAAVFGVYAGTGVSIEVRIRERGDGSLKLTRYEVDRLPGGKRRRKLIQPPDGRTAQLFELLEAIHAPPRRRRGKWSRMTTGASGHGGGVPPFIPLVVRPLLASAGYSVWRGQVKRTWATFLTPAAAKVRFDLMDDAAKKSVGSAERLHQASLIAYRLMKSRNRRAIPTSYDQCLSETLASMRNCG